jgi:hypothetical protein
VSDGKTIDDGVDFERTLVEGSVDDPLEDFEVEKSGEGGFDVVGDWFAFATIQKTVKATLVESRHGDGSVLGVVLKRGG